MKLIFSVLAAVALTLVPSAFAQQMVSPPGNIAPTPEPAAGGTPEKAPVPPAAAEEPPAETRSVEPVTPEPATSGLPAAERKTSVAKPAATATRPKSALEPETPAGKPPRKGHVDANLKEMENKWEAAIVAHDPSVVDELVASDFSGINSKGRFINKTALLAELKGDADTYKSAKNEKLNVRVYGTSTAVVTGSARARGTTKEGRTFDRTYRFTDTWMERDGKWQCIASQDSILPPQHR